jgi:hypothetical protein
MQDPRNVRLIPVAVELGLHGVRRGRHLAQGQGGGEYLEQECFHEILQSSI